ADVLLIVEARDVVIGLRRERGTADASARIGAEKGEATAMDQVVDEGGNEDRLAGASEPGDAETERWCHDPDGPFRQRGECQARLVGYRGKLQACASGLEGSHLVRHWRDPLAGEMPIPNQRISPDVGSCRAVR